MWQVRGSFHLCFAFLFMQKIRISEYLEERVRRGTEKRGELLDSIPGCERQHAVSLRLFARPLLQGGGVEWEAAYLVILQMSLGIQKQNLLLQCLVLKCLLPNPLTMSWSRRPDIQAVQNNGAWDTTTKVPAVPD